MWQVVTHREMIYIKLCHDSRMRGPTSSQPNTLPPQYHRENQTNIHYIGVGGRDIFLMICYDDVNRPVSATTMRRYARHSTSRGRSGTHLTVYFSTELKNHMFYGLVEHDSCILSVWRMSNVYIE